MFKIIRDGQNMYKKILRLLQKFRLGGASAVAFASKTCDDLHPLRCLLLDLLTAGSPEEAEEVRLAALTLRLRLGGGRGPGARVGCLYYNYTCALETL
jgi:hypothetical protein